jgi:hypothetical protein
VACSIKELKVGLNGTEIDVLGITTWHEWVVIVWAYATNHARSWLMVGYDEGRKALPVNGNQSLGLTTHRRWVPITTIVG